MSQVGLLCCCDDVVVPECPGNDECGVCDPDVVVFQFSAAGTCTQAGTPYSWEVTEGTFTPTARYVPNPGNLTFGCGWERRSGSGPRVTFSGAGPLAGQYVTSLSDDVPILRCISTPAGLVSLGRLRGNSGFGFVGVDISAEGPYVQCALGWTLDPATIQGGPFVDVGGGDPLEDVVVTDLVLAFA